MTDREQIRRWLGDLMEENLALPAGMIRDLLAELKQAERERDKYRGEWEQEIRAALIRCEAVEARLVKADALAEALRLEKCNGCGKPRKEWGPVCGGMLQGDNTHYHSLDWWLGAYEQEQKP